MADDSAYVGTLAGQLREQRPDLLAIAEDELQTLRGSMRKVADFLHNQAIALDIRRNLAADLHLPEPDR
ncbi:hypothetical protein [Streptomyces violaceus]|uniref:Integrase n=1 Tax=Streptomyces violaceus TaxID=1936 RepID=A0ABY9UMS8_STRVL|nr:hypothetical protein [Streptomyces janthinus]WND24170.1 hypothetical protein RI060_43395 [Streptomyces janthinus]GGS96706.1 hypothetical protein GCM10010270_80820 [Streptomyces janthinus]